MLRRVRLEERGRAAEQRMMAPQHSMELCDLGYYLATGFYIAFGGNPRVHGLLTGLCLPAKLLVSFCFSQCHVERGEQLRLSIRVTTSFLRTTHFDFYGARETTLFKRTCCRENLTEDSNFSLSLDTEVTLLGCSQHCLRPQVLFDD